MAALDPDARESRQKNYIRASQNGPLVSQRDCDLNLHGRQTRRVGLGLRLDLALIPFLVILLKNKQPKERRLTKSFEIRMRRIKKLWSWSKLWRRKKRLWRRKKRLWRRKKRLWKINKSITKTYWKRLPCLTLAGRGSSARTPAGWGLIPSDRCRRSEFEPLLAAPRLPLLRTSRSRILWPR